MDRIDTKLKRQRYKLVTKSVKLINKLPVSLRTKDRIFLLMERMSWLDRLIGENEERQCYKERLAYEKKNRLRRS